jgi:hypothetical protein
MAQRLYSVTLSNLGRGEKDQNIYLHMSEYSDKLSALFLSCLDKNENGQKIY